jgi:hypothetical protein
VFFNVLLVSGAMSSCEDKSFVNEGSATEMELTIAILKRHLASILYNIISLTLSLLQNKLERLCLVSIFGLV